MRPFFQIRSCMFSYIVVIAAGADSVNDEGANLLDAGEFSNTHGGILCK